MQLMRKNTFAIHTLGCKVNTYESDAIVQKMRAAGFVELGFDEGADIYIINTCTVTNIADRKSRQMLRRARKMNPKALIVAAGCYVDDAEKNDKLGELIESGVIDLAVSNRDKARAVELISEKLNENVNISGAEEFLTQLDGHSRAFLKVQDGCNMYCSYCIIPYVRGPLHARPKEDVIRETELLAENGIAEVVLTGIHLSSLRNGLLELIEGIEKIDGIRRIRLGSLEPMLITDEYAAALSGFSKLCPHFHLSLQSGDNDILRAMNRHYTAEQYADACGVLRKYYDHPAITTDIIVGFPGETEDQFLNTCSFAEQIGFYEAHVFKYSRRKGTPADRMEGQITEAEKSRRSEILIGITDRLSRTFREYYLGRQVEFLSEELVTIGGRSYETGYTPEYVRCLKPSDELHQNVILSGKGSQIVQENVMDESILLEYNK